MNRIVGLETEYGCLTGDPAGPPGAVGKVRNFIFDSNRFGLADMHQRDWDEPAGNGGFLFNGGRAYVDMGHLEYCTPECVSLCDLVRYDRAGDAILEAVVEEMGLSAHVNFIRNNIDHYSGATFGCHENYLVRRSAPLTESNVMSLLGFLTLRLLYTGAGRVGCTVGAEMRDDLERSEADGRFQISQRADYINNDLFEWVQFNRAIINTRDEPLADARRFRRLHLLHGDTSVLPVTLILKAGTTSLVLDLMEADHLPKVALADAVTALRSFSHHPDGPWTVPLTDGRRVDAVEMLSWYQEAAKQTFAGRDEETDALLLLWGDTLQSLASNPDQLIGQVDWITKRWLFRQFVEREGIDWTDGWLRSQDLEFHHIIDDRNLARALEKTPSPWADLCADYRSAMDTPPANSRAHVRSRVMHLLRDQTRRYFVDWEVVDVEGFNSLNLLDPFDPQPEGIDAWIEQVREAIAGQ